VDLAIGIVGAAFLAGSIVAISSSIRLGRTLAQEIEQRHPDVYEDIGRPVPTYFESARRSRFLQFVMRREYLELPDPMLIERFEQYRRSQIRLVVVSLSVLLSLAAAILHVGRSA
jgi:hypothetical protein